MCNFQIKWSNNHDDVWTNIGSYFVGFLKLMVIIISFMLKSQFSDSLDLKCFQLNLQNITLQFQSCLKNWSLDIQSYPILSTIDFKIFMNEPTNRKKETATLCLIIFLKLESSRIRLIDMPSFDASKLSYFYSLFHFIIVYRIV